MTTSGPIRLSSPIGLPDFGAIRIWRLSKVEQSIWYVRSEVLEQFDADALENQSALESPSDSRLSQLRHAMIASLQGVVEFGPSGGRLTLSALRRRMILALKSHNQDAIEIISERNPSLSEAGSVLYMEGEVDRPTVGGKLQFRFADFTSELFNHVTEPSLLIGSALVEQLPDASDVKPASQLNGSASSRTSTPTPVAPIESAVDTGETEPSGDYLKDEDAVRRFVMSELTRSPQSVNSVMISMLERNLIERDNECVLKTIALVEKIYSELREQEQVDAFDPSVPPDVQVPDAGHTLYAFSRNPSDTSTPRPASPPPPRIDRRYIVAVTARREAADDLLADLIEKLENVIGEEVFNHTGDQYVEHVILPQLKTIQKLNSARHDPDASTEKELAAANARYTLNWARITYATARATAPASPAKDAETISEIAQGIDNLDQFFTPT